MGKHAELYLFSDGVYELTDPEGKMWDYQKFLDTLNAEPPEGQTKLDGIVAAAKKYHGSGNFEDDYSLVRFVF